MATNRLCRLAFCFEVKWRSVAFSRFQNILVFQHRNTQHSLDTKPKQAQLCDQIKFLPVFVLSPPPPPASEQPGQWLTYHDQSGDVYFPNQGPRMAHPFFVIILLCCCGCCGSCGSCGSQTITHYPFLQAAHIYIYFMVVQNPNPDKDKVSAMKHEVGATHPPLCLGVGGLDAVRQTLRRERIHKRINLCFHFSGHLFWHEPTHLCTPANTTHGSFDSPFWPPQCRRCSPWPYTPFTGREGVLARIAWAGLDSIWSGWGIGRG